MAHEDLRTTIEEAFENRGSVSFSTTGRVREAVATALEPGLYFRVPFIDNVVYIEKRLIGFAPNAETVRDAENEIVTGDRRRINVLAFGRYRVVDPLAFYQAVGTMEVANSRLLAILDASVRSMRSGHCTSSRRSPMWAPPGIMRMD